MAKQCEICGKGSVTGRSVSHAHNVSSRKFQANLQRVRVHRDGSTRRAWVCTRCLRTGKVEKPPVRTWEAEEAEA